MVARNIRILQLDDSLSRQKILTRRFNPHIVNLKSFSLSCRIWMDRKSAAKISSFLDPALKNMLTFLGSGDYHHLSSLLIEQFNLPLSVIIFDHHPDWFAPPPELGCGSWVARILKKDNIKKVILLGPSSDDISAKSIFTGVDLNFFKDDRLELYPYEHAPTKAFFKKVPDNVSFNKQGGKFYEQINWQEMRGKNLEDFLLKIIQRLPFKQVYVSIDKDCLKSDYALTNWEEGRFSLDELLLMLKVIKKNLDIVGLDITGEYSLPQVTGIRRAIISRFDHPRAFSARNKSPELINKVNEETNMKILELLLPNF